jgi:hypothetical protein
MGRSRQIAVCVVALLLAIGPARADFIKDAREWKSLGPDGQAGYAMAIFDVMTVAVNGDPFSAARANGLRACALTLKLKAANVAQAITKFYVDMPQARHVTPFVAFNNYMERGACSPFINQARRDMGLPPMKGPPSAVQMPRQQEELQQP